MNMTNIDKLYANVAQNGHVCVGLDTDISYLPEPFALKFPNIEDGLVEFNKALIDSTLDVCACYKVQIAYYEAYGMAGLRAYARTLAYLREKNAVVIADIKRGDIAKTAEMYAKAHFTGEFEADFITLSPYMGLDSLSPYLPYIKENGKGVFVLIRTSNEGAKDIEYLPTENGKRVYHVVGEKLQTLGKDYMGECGYSAIGGVMGCTHPDEAAEIRDMLSTTFFLIPGYGAQGGKAEDIAKYLRNGNGGVVNSSRGILLAWRKQDDGASQFADYARAEAIRMRDDILKWL
jgi:orotidine-5'-phosphate decarboxylase